MKPKIFIGCSVAGLEIARAIAENLERDAECNLWDNDIFKLSVPNLTALVNEMNNSDFGVFVFKPDDPVTVKKMKRIAVRDNVIFEAGMFIGGLSANRVLMIKPMDRPDVKIPTDLDGITLGEYDENKKVETAVQTFCNQVRRHIVAIGYRLDKPTIKYGHVEELHHVNLPVRNLKKSLEFYGGILGLRKIERPFKFPGAWLGLPSGQQLHLVVAKKGTYRKGERNAKNIVAKDSHFALRVDPENFKEISDRLKLNNIPVGDSPDKSVGIVQIYTLDPDCHIIEINALKPHERVMKFIEK